MKTKWLSGWPFNIQDIMESNPLARLLITGKQALDRGSLKGVEVGRK